MNLESIPPIDLYDQPVPRVFVLDPELLPDIEHFLKPTPGKLIRVQSIKIDQVIKVIS